MFISNKTRHIGLPRRKQKLKQNFGDTIDLLANVINNIYIKIQLSVNIHAQRDKTKMVAGYCFYNISRLWRQTFKLTNHISNENAALNTSSNYLQWIYIQLNTSLI